jgi:hypothetical protein
VIEMVKNLDKYSMRTSGTQWQADYETAGAVLAEQSHPPGAQSGKEWSFLLLAVKLICLTKKLNFCEAGIRIIQ